MILPAADPPVVCFLKRTILHRPPKNLPALLQLRQPHTDVYREMQLVQNLQDRGIPVMRIMAWGEERKFGLPIRGFILTANVPGQSLHEMFLSSDAKRRRRIAMVLGSFVARLHTLGFFQTVRLKDLICPDPQLLSVTLIDRAASTAGRRFFWSRFCIQSLQRGFRRMKRDGIVYEPELKKVFAIAYSEGVAGKWKVTPQDLQASL